MKFGFINIGTKFRYNSFINLLAARGFYLHVAHDYKAGDDFLMLNQCLSCCDVIFVAAERARFCEIFNVSDIDSNAAYHEIGTLLYIFLDSPQSIKGIEEIIRNYYARLKIRMSYYRIFLEQGKTPDFGTLFDPEKSGVTDKYSLTHQQSGHFLDIMVRYRSDSRIANLNKQILDRYFNYTYSTNFTPLSELISSLLIKHNAKIKLAESFTGGRIAASLTSIAGASSYLLESLVTYSEDSKKRRLDIPGKMLEKCGAVSFETACEMARSLLKSGCDVAVSTTGNAGPTAQSGAGVGKCFIAVAVPGKIEVNEYDFLGSREEITESGVSHALFLLYRKLKMAYN